MAFNGYLSKFSLPEIFEFLEQGSKTGLLSIEALKDDLPDNLNTNSENYYIWLRQGRILAAASNLDNQGLISMIVRRGLVSERIATEKFQTSGGKMAMGLCLKSSGLVTAEQLTLLFRAQIMEQVSSLFELKNGKFNFDTQASIPTAEMTGLTMLTTEATIKGLRNLRNWSALTAKLPDSNFGISKKINNLSLSQIKLDTQESRVWECADGQTSLQEIANQLFIPLEKVRRIAFRLIISNLVKEAYIIHTSQTSTTEYSEKCIDLDAKNEFVKSKESSLLSQSHLSNFKNNQSNYAINDQKHNRSNNQKQGIVGIEKKETESEVSKATDNFSSDHRVDISSGFLESLVGFLQTKVES